MAVPVVTTPRFPDFVFPTVPEDLAATASATEHQRAWQFLQSGDVRNAERGFSATLKQMPAFYPAHAGLGYVGLAERDYRDAISRFDRALARAPGYVPALVGRGEALLASDRAGDALASFEAALAADSSLSAIGRRVEMLRFRVVQEYVDAARRAAEGGRGAEALQSYLRAIAASPDSAFLYRELAIIEQREGQPAAAFAHASTAVQLDPQDARAHALLGELLEARGEIAEAIAAYERAIAIDPAEELRARLARARANEKLASLPPEYHTIPQTSRVSRGELAALLGVQLEELIQSARERQGVVMTDMRDHWAAPWILPVARAGAMEVYPNHTFQPRAVVRRGELAQVVSHLLKLIAPRNPELARRWLGARGRFSDLGPGNLNYTAASGAVAAGVMPMLEGETFQLSRPVTGAEAIAAIARLQTLAEQAGHP